MKVLFAVSNEKMSEAIVKQYQKDYKEIISYKNVYYFNAILKELQRDKTYDRVVISEDLEQYVNSDYEQMDNFIFGRLDSISDEAVNMKGEDIPIILICDERRNKSEQILVKLFGIGIYNAVLGNDRTVSEISKLIYRPRVKKEAKLYYKIDVEDVTYEKDDENDVSELEIQNILAHYKRLGNDEEKYVESFDSIASQYNDAQLKIISQCLPLKVRAVLEEKSPKYQQVNAYTTKIADGVRVKKQQQSGTSGILLKNSNSKKLTQPVVVPSAIGINTEKKLITRPVSKTETLQSTEQSHKLQAKIENILNTPQPTPEETDDDELNLDDIETPTIEENVEEQVEPVKRGRGRPRKIVTEPVEEKPKRKRGRPRKNPLPEEENVVEDNSQETNSHEANDESIEETTLPGLEDEASDDTILPGLEDENKDENEEDDTTLPGFEDEDADDETLPGFENDDAEDSTLPGLTDEDEDQTSKLDNSNSPSQKQEEPKQGQDHDEEVDYENVLNNLRRGNLQEEQYNQQNKEEEDVQYPELDMESLLAGDKKLVAFVGTSKNGTSFLVNNVAEILSMNGIDTAILDLTQNRNAYYIYTKNEEYLRVRANQCISNLIQGEANGIPHHKNLTIYTSAYEMTEVKHVEPILETLLNKHKVVLLDCDFGTPMRYFKYAQEIYLVQSMDILTIQPLTLFLRNLTDKGMFEQSKARVVLNKFIKTREINEDLLIGGISIYNDAGMTVRKELFDRKTVTRITIPFDLDTYLSYLDGLVICDVTLKGYSKKLTPVLKELASMVYQKNKKNKKYVPPSIKKDSTFSPSVNDTLNQMKQNY